MKVHPKRDYPFEHVRRLLEPGPVVLVTSAHKGENNIMTMGWHTVMEFAPALVGGIIASSNHSFDLIRKSGECVINIPTADMIDTVVAVGNTTGGGFDKFDAFGLTLKPAQKVEAPLIDECFANFECKVEDTRFVNKYNFFVFRVVKAHVTPFKRFPQTLHYHGQGVFTTDGRKIDKSRQFVKWQDSPTF